MHGESTLYLRSACTSKHLHDVNLRIFSLLTIRIVDGIFDDDQMSRKVDTDCQSGGGAYGIVLIICKLHIHKVLPGLTYNEKDPFHEMLLNQMSIRIVKPYAYR